MEVYKMYNRNDSSKKIAKRNATHKAYQTKKNYVEKTCGRCYNTHKKKSSK